MDLQTLPSPTKAIDASKLNPEDIVLSDGQQAALEKFTSFLMSPMETTFVLCGYAGTGKSTLVKVLLNRLPKLLQMIRLLNYNLPDWDVQLTATTNKAAEALQGITGQEVLTIHSYLGLRVQTDWTTRETSLHGTNRLPPQEGVIVFIDEASYIDSELLGYIFKRIGKCKVVFMGDPAQLSPVKSRGTPVFDAGFPTAMLTEVLRQAEGSPIIELATKFRETVSSGEFFQFKPDGQHIQYLERDAFEQQILAEFTREDWKYSDSKVLAWTNRAVIAYNHGIRDRAKGSPVFAAGDYAICNHYVQGTNRAIKTDQLVLITRVSQVVEQQGVKGRWYTVDGAYDFFMPNSLEDWKNVVKRLKAAGEFSTLDRMERTWIDLRAAYACTINKSQGSTYDRVFIDLDDIARCNSGDQIARMLYVAVSRARHQVFLTGDLV